MPFRKNNLNIIRIYMSTIAGKNAAATEEDPTQMSVAVGKAFTNYKRVIFGLLIFAFSSWQLSILDESNPDFGPKKFFPSNPENTPYASEKARFKMSPLTAFWNILLSFMGNGLVGMSRGMKCCPKEARMEKRKIHRGGYSKRSKVQRGAGKDEEECGDILSNTSLTWGNDEWKPFDIYSNKIGWPYDEMYISPEISFSYWLGRSQMVSWMIPRQIFQAILLILANFAIPKKGKGKNGTDSSFLWFTRLLVTLILPFVFVFSLVASTIVAVISTIWGGFFQHLLDGNFTGLLWGFFLTWILIIYNVIAQPLELLASLFTIPFIHGGKKFVKENFSSWKKEGKEGVAGYKQIISFMLTISIMAISFNAFSPMIMGASSLK